MVIYISQAINYLHYIRSFGGLMHGALISGSSGSDSSPGAHFMKVPKSFDTQKSLAKSQAS